MKKTLLHNLRLLDPETGKTRKGLSVLIDGIKVTKVAEKIDASPDTTRIDLGGRVLMPGLIDCHVHVTAIDRNGAPFLPSYMNAMTTVKLREMLLRGFTTARDTAGADAGHREGVAEGHLIGPRLFVSGRGIGQTGGHGDLRSRVDQPSPCRCHHFMTMNFGFGCRIADGVSEVRRAVRDEIRLGADQIKVFASGGVGSPADPIHFLQYSEEELRAIVDEATRSDTYALAHAYTAPAIYRAVDYGVRTIEHGNFLDTKTADLIAKRDAFLVPTLIAYRKEVEFGAAIPAVNLEKAKQVLEVGTKSLEVAKAAGVQIAFGSDLMGDLDKFQNEEFDVRCEVLSAHEVVRSATIVAAKLLRREHELGTLAPGAYADAIVVDHNPCERIDVLGSGGRYIRMIMKEGRIYKDEISPRHTPTEARRDTLTATA